MGERSSVTHSVGPVMKMAIISRLVVLFLVIVFDSAVTDYDTSALVDSPCVNFPSEPEIGVRSHVASSGSSSSSACDHNASGLWSCNHVSRLGSVLEGAITWDSVFFVRIARCGYEYEQMHAFLPLFPLMMSALRSTVFRPLVNIIGERATLALAGYLINNIAFVIAAVLLYRLSCEIISDERLAFQATALFCYNPATIFYFSLYTESLFALFSFAGLFYLVNGLTWRAAILFGFSSLTRSNGVLNGGFFLFKAFQITYRSLFRVNQPKEAVKAVMTGIVQAALTAAPFLLFQWYGYHEFCRQLSDDERPPRPWCLSKVPYLYGFVQSHYWNVGFLKYFKIKQLPNFLLASPMLVLSFSAIFHYVWRNSRLCASLGLSSTEHEFNLLTWQRALSSTTHHHAEATESTNGQSTTVSKDSTDVGAVSNDHQLTSVRQRANKNGFIVQEEAPGQQNKPITSSSTNDDTELVSGVPVDTTSSGFYSPAVFCFLCQLAFMLFVCICIMHVQVATRFLASNPVIYWYGAMLMWQGAAGSKSSTVSSGRQPVGPGRTPWSVAGENRSGALGRTVWTVFLCYVAIGTLLFTNFYPFT